MNTTHTFTARVLDDGRKSVSVLAHNHPQNAFNPATFATVRNIDGSNRLMRDDGGWNFLPSEYEDAAWAAIARAEGSEYRYPHMVPAWAALA